MAQTTARETSPSADVEEFRVERILGHRVRQRATQYKVHWSGFRLDEATWEPAGHLANSQETVDEYWNALKEKRKKPPKLPRPKRQQAGAKAAKAARSRKKTPAIKERAASAQGPSNFQPAQTYRSAHQQEQNEHPKLRVDTPARNASLGGQVATRKRAKSSAADTPTTSKKPRLEVANEQPKDATPNRLKESPSSSSRPIRACAARSDGKDAKKSGCRQSSNDTPAAAAKLTPEKTLCRLERDTSSGEHSQQPQIDESSAGSAVQTNDLDQTTPIDGAFVPDEDEEKRTSVEAATQAVAAQEKSAESPDESVRVTHEHLEAHAGELQEDVLVPLPNEPPAVCQPQDATAGDLPTAAPMEAVVVVRMPPVQAEKTAAVTTDLRLIVCPDTEPRGVARLVLSTKEMERVEATFCAPTPPKAAECAPSAPVEAAPEDATAGLPQVADSTAKPMEAAGIAEEPPAQKTAEVIAEVLFDARPKTNEGTEHVIQLKEMAFVRATFSAPTPAAAPPPEAPECAPPTPAQAAPEEAAPESPPPTPKRVVLNIPQLPKTWWALPAKAPSTDYCYQLPDIQIIPIRDDEQDAEPAAAPIPAEEPPASTVTPADSPNTPTASTSAPAAEEPRPTSPKPKVVKLTLPPAKKTTVRPEPEIVVLSHKPLGLRDPRPNAAKHRAEAAAMLARQQANREQNAEQVASTQPTEAPVPEPERTAAQMAAYENALQKMVDYYTTWGLSKYPNPFVNPENASQPVRFRDVFRVPDRATGEVIPMVAVEFGGRLRLHAAKWSDVLDSGNSVSFWEFLSRRPAVQSGS
ncbi:hypothetical protein M3Y99_01427800 [Aphelenchoides fujianensis]|nr:hypothetical protein M3Y99_01427800 [Aphelenchoides fujianensis]